MTASPPVPRRNPLDLVVSIVLMVVSVGVALVLFVGAFLWGMGGPENFPAMVLGMAGPIVATVSGIVVTIFSLVRRRLSFWIPLAAMALSLILWLIAGVMTTGS